MKHNTDEGGFNCLSQLRHMVSWHLKKKSTTITFHRNAGVLHILPAIIRKAFLLYQTAQSILPCSFLESPNKFSKREETERKTGHAIKSAVLIQKGKTKKQKTVSSTWAFGERKKKGKKKRNKPRASTGFLYIHRSREREDTMVTSTQVILKGIV